MTDENKINLLIIDDSIEDVEAYKRFLKKDSSCLYSIIISETGKNGLEKLKNTSVDCLLLDYRLPDMNGLEIIEIIRNDTKCKWIPIIFLTAFGDENIAAQSIKSGADDYLIKDQLTVETLVRSIRHSIEQKSITQKLHESEDRYRRLVELSLDLMALKIEGKLVYINSAGAYMLGANHPEQLIGKSLTDYIHPDYVNNVNSIFQKISSLEEVTSSLEIKIIHPNDKVLDVELLVAPVFYTGKPALQIVGRDITQRKNLEHLLKELSISDELTGIPNRRKINEYLLSHFKNSIRNKLFISIIMIDIDHFKLYNDTYGHLAGDNCLKAVADAITESISRPQDMAGRYGGEEFIVILPDTDLKGAVHVAEKIRLNVLEKKIKHEFSPVNPVVTISLGAASIIPSGKTKYNYLIELSDKALYKAKNSGRNKIESLEN